MSNISLFIIVTNSINKLPLFTRLDEDISEAELQGTYIDPIMSSMFHRPEENRYFRWYVNTLHFVKNSIYWSISYCIFFLLN